MWCLCAVPAGQSSALLLCLLVVLLPKGCRERRVADVGQGLAVVWLQNIEGLERNCSSPRVSPLRSEAFHRAQTSQASQLLFLLASDLSAPYNVSIP